MSKREARSIAAAGVDIDAPRAKRRKEAPATTSTSPDGKQDASASQEDGDGKTGEGSTSKGGEDRDAIRETGLRVWWALKEARRKGYAASNEFLRLPSKRQYPDYYEQIKRPIAMNDIIARIDKRKYADVDDIRHDLATCFRNAKRYNIKNSEIWKDAKFLHRLLNREFGRLTGIREKSPPDDADEASGEEAIEKKRISKLNSVLREKYYKVLDQTDRKGHRVLAEEFLKLPDGKYWTSYYRIIKKPLALDNIYGKLRRNMYQSVTDFADDMELVFANALKFNVEGTQITKDATTLRDHFRKIMADLPEPYAIPAYANASKHPTKIKLKIPSAPTQPVAASAPTLPSSNTITVPRSHVASSATTHAAATPQATSIATASLAGPPSVVESPVDTPALPSTSAPILAAAQASSSHSVRPTVAASAPSISAAASQPSNPTYTSALLPTSSSQGATPATYYPNAVYQQPIAPAIAPKATAASPPAPRANLTAAPAPIAPAAVARSSPPSATQYSHPLKHAVITTMPLHRRLVLDHEDGARTWMMRLDGQESSVILSNIALLGHHDHDEDSSGDEEHEDKIDDVVGASTAKGKKRARPARKRGKVSEVSKKAKGKATEPGLGGIQVKLNGAVLKRTEGGEWEVPVPPGINVLELGEKGGMAWKVYLDRAAN